MARRLPSTPPILPGFSFVRVLGSGGFADVFLYEQNLPRRQVAVKVMLAEVVNSHVRDMFQAEANLMAQLSAHPSILTVYEASVSSDGRPYLVMELCSSSVSDRYRREAIPVAQVLRIAVKISSAIETAHRAGVLHRDIKPSNILMTAYGHPVLSDFGIASTLGESDVTEAVGLSIPWSAPEVLMDESFGTVASEVFSLAATVYSLLAGRSPFEVPGSDNTTASLMSRISKAKPIPVGRPDVPPRLEAILAKAMSRRPEARHGSAMEFARDLQSIETELGVPQTAAEVAVEDWAAETASDPDDRTRIKAVTPVGPNPKRRRRTVKTTAPVTYVSIGSAARASGGAHSTGSGTAQTGPRNPRTRALLWSLVACVALVLVLGGTAGVVLLKVGSNNIPGVGAIDADINPGSVTFSWHDPGLAKTDSYEITTQDGITSSQRANDFRVDATNGERVCITVTVNREGKLGEPSGQKCAEVLGAAGP